MRKNEYLISDIVSVPASGSISFLALTNGANVVFNPQAVSSDVSPIRIELYEITDIADITTQGTLSDLVTPTNLTNERVNTVGIYTGSTVDLTGYKAKFKGLASGTKQSGGTAQPGTVLYLNKETYYYYVITNLATSTAQVSTTLTWQEFASV